MERARGRGRTEEGGREGPGAELGRETRRSVSSLSAEERAVCQLLYEALYKSLTLRDESVAAGWSTGDRWRKKEREEERSREVRGELPHGEKKALFTKRYRSRCMYESTYRRATDS